MKLKQLHEAEYGRAINLAHKSLTQLPSDLPEKVEGYFFCHDNNIASLEHCPSEVGGMFNCSYNKLTSLDHGPTKIGGNFFCSYNKLTSLEHCPSEVGGDFYCSNNNLTSLKDIHKRVKKIGAVFVCHNNPIKSHILGLILVDIGGDIMTELGDGSDVDVILNKWKNQGRKGVLGAQRELIAAGYKELAQL